MAVQDPLSLFTALAHMPRLEELVLFLITFTRYEGDLPIPAFSLRRYVYTNVRANGASPSSVLGRVRGWSLPLTASTKTLRQFNLTLRIPSELDEGLLTPDLELLERLGLCGHRYNGFPKNLEGYASLIARCPRLRELGLHWISRDDIAHDLELLSASTTLLRSVELSLNPERSPPDGAGADAALAHVLRTAPPLRHLRFLKFIFPHRPDTPAPEFSLVRAVCAERQIGFLLVLQQAR
ncbi:hypothetical protein AURDEDRAFT_187143 [Auricularia subglabra TFB-10046 SS5]|nr:hypothetical protein AURDEDRAFT_187143 [Auricularia subglabra TFB-10046 SS5]